MSPSLEDGDIVLALKRSPAAGQIVIIQQGDREVIKRVESIKGRRYYVLGDNSDQSTDSRHYGHVSKKAILGTIMIILPRAVAPPKPLRRYGAWFGRGVGALLIVLVLVHLFRIDTFIPILDEALPSGPLMATIAALVIILSELFAIPFALRMKLSPLAHLVSGALIIFAPLWWIAVDILTIGATTVSTGQLGEFVSVPSSMLVIGINLVWLALAYATLHVLGYNHLQTRRGLSK